MATIGKYNALKVTRSTPKGIYVDAEEFGELFMPILGVTDRVEIGDEFSVFLYIDYDGQCIATMQRPSAMPGELAILKVASIETNGVLMEWDIPNLLFIPAQEQQQKMVQGQSYVVYVHHKPQTERIAGSTKLDKYLSATSDAFRLDQEVELMICDQSDLGYRAVINNIAMGFIYSNDVYQTLNIGDKVQGYIKNIREDKRIDLYLQKAGFSKIVDIGDQILDKIKKNGGSLPVTDKSPADTIYKMFGVSKKSYKKAVGGLYKKGEIILEKDRISLSSKSK